MRLKRARPAELSIRRRRHGRGFGYTTEDGTAIRDRETYDRIRALGIPPAWTEVRISGHPRTHIQAVGTDAAGRQQYIYHPDWEARRTRRKQQQLALPRIRRRIREGLTEPTGSKHLAIAIGLALIDRTAMRVGRERYLDAHGTRGAGTLFTRDVTVAGDKVRISFPAKSGKTASYSFADAALAAAIGAIKSIPGKRLLMYRTAEGKPAAVRTEDLNRALREMAGAPVTAKDFRTLHGSAMAAETLAKLEPAPSQSARRRQMAAATKTVAAFLQNTPAICRSSYIAPCLYALFDKGRLQAMWAAGGDGAHGVRQREVRLASVLAAAG